MQIIQFQKKNTEIQGGYQMRTKKKKITEPHPTNRQRKLKEKFRKEKKKQNETKDTKCIQRMKNTYS